MHIYIYIGISTSETISNNTNIHMMMCIRRNICSSSITLYLRIRIPPVLEPKRGGCFGGLSKQSMGR